MALQVGQQYLRAASLFVYNDALVADGPENYQPAGALDLSGFHFKFKTSQDDEESPSSCSIRVYNLTKITEQKIRDEFSRVVVSAGYQKGPFGIVFDGTVKQIRRGRESPTLTYIDILAADGDVAYNWAIVNQSMAAGSTHGQRTAAVLKAMESKGVSAGQLIAQGTGGILPRGKVLFGFAKAELRGLAASQLSTWSIQNGKVQIIPLDEYLPGDAVILNAATGLLGRVEQTQEGMRARCLLNPAITVGGTVRINNSSINQTQSAPGVAIPGGQLAYNQWAGVQQFADVSADGLYRVYVAEHAGDTRGKNWYTDIICLTVDASTGKVQPYGY